MERNFCSLWVVLSLKTLWSRDGKILWGRGGGVWEVGYLTWSAGCCWWRIKSKSNKKKEGGNPVQIKVVLWLSTIYLTIHLKAFCRKTKFDPRRLVWRDKPVITCLFKHTSLLPSSFEPHYWNLLWVSAWITAGPPCSQQPFKNARYINMVAMVAPRHPSLNFDCTLLLLDCPMWCAPLLWLWYTKLYIKCGTQSI